MSTARMNLCVSISRGAADNDDKKSHLPKADDSIRAVDATGRSVHIVADYFLR